MAVILAHNQYGKAETRVVRVYRDTEPHEIGRLQRQRRPERRLRRRPPDRRQHQVPDHRRHEEHRQRVRQGAGRRGARAGVVRAGAGAALRRRRPAGRPGADPGRDVPVGPAVQRRRRRTRTRSRRAADTCARRPSPTAMAARGSCPGCATSCVLKTTDSEFHGFYTDRYTTLAPTTDDRIMATLGHRAVAGTPTTRSTWGDVVRRRARHDDEHLRGPLQPGAAADDVRDGRADDRGPAGDRRGAVLAAEQAPLRDRPQPVRPGEQERGVPRRRPAVRPHRGHHPPRRRARPRPRAFDPGQGW